MKTVYKYVLDPGGCFIKIPSTFFHQSEIMSVECQGDAIVVYALVNTEIINTVTYEFKVFGTGHELPDNLNKFTFLGTVKMYNGSLMFHVFYRVAEERE